MLGAWCLSLLSWNICTQLDVHGPEPLPGLQNEIDMDCVTFFCVIVISLTLQLFKQIKLLGDLRKWIGGILLGFIEDSKLGVDVLDSTSSWRLLFSSHMPILLILEDIHDGT